MLVLLLSVSVRGELLSNRTSVNMTLGDSGALLSNRTDVNLTLGLTGDETNPQINYTSETLADSTIFVLERL